MNFRPSIETLNIGHPYRDEETSRLFFSHNDIETWALTLSTTIDLKAHYKEIVAVARGGLYLGAMLSHHTSIALSVMSYTRSKSQVNVPPLKCEPGSRILLVEDIAGLGRTLVDCKSALLELGYEVDVAVLAFDALSREKPNYGIDCSSGGQRIVFPWERGLIKPTVKTNDVGDYLDPWTVGFDLDGVFLPDVPSELYATNLPKALSDREALEAFEHKPVQYSPLKPSPVITGRLTSEYRETVDWLKRYGIECKSLHMRPSLQICPAEFKAQTIKALNVTEFVESERWQAEKIANAAPYCVVWHYEHQSRRSTRVFPGQTGS